MSSAPEHDFDAQRVRDLHLRALAYRVEDPEAALTKARQVAETIARRLYRDGTFEKSSRPLNKLLLNDLLTRLEQESVLPRHIALPMRTLQFYGNFGTHYQGQESEKITTQYIGPGLEALAVVVPWFLTDYCGLAPPAEEPPATPVRAPAPQPRRARRAVVGVLVLGAATLGMWSLWRPGRPSQLDGWYVGNRDPLPPSACRADDRQARRLGEAVAQSPERALPLLADAGEVSAEGRFVRAILAGASARAADRELAAGCEGFAAAQNLAGKAALQAGETDAALAWFEKALASQPDYFKPAFNKALALLQQGRTADGTNLLISLRGRHPDDGDVDFALGHALAATGRGDEARAAFCRAAAHGIQAAAERCAAP